MATATARRRRAIEHLVATDLARARLARAAYDAVIDGLDLGPIAIRTTADREWVQVAIAGPIQRAADEALCQLVDDLIEVLEPGDPEIVARMLGHAPDFEPVAAEVRDAPWRMAVDRPGRPGRHAERTAQRRSERSASAARAVVLR